MASNDELIEATARRSALVDGLLQRGLIHDAAVESAFRTVPRHLFVPGVPLDVAYADQSIATKTRGGLTLSSSSQPAIMAIMLEQLALQPGENVLEIGAGTGYNAALMQNIVGAQGRVTTIDVDEDIVAAARENLAGAGWTQVQVVLADGGFGYPLNAPYDAVIATVGVWDLSPHWLDQLRQGGRLVVPLQFGVRQFSIAFERHESELVSHSSVPCGFLQLRGAFASPHALLELDSIVVQHDNVPDLNSDALNRLLAITPRSETVQELEIPGSTGLLDYIALRGGKIFSLFDRERKRLEAGLAFGLYDNASLALYTMDAGWDEIEPTVQVYGDDTSLVQLREYIAQWTASGRPDLAASRFTAALLSGAQPDSGHVVVRKKWMQYYIEFENRE